MEFKKIYKEKLLNLWLDENTKEHFSKLDATELRAQEKSVAVPITEDKTRGVEEKHTFFQCQEQNCEKNSKRKEGY